MAIATELPETVLENYFQTYDQVHFNWVLSSPRFPVLFNQVLQSRKDS